MKQNKAIREMIHDARLTQRELAIRLGYKRPSSITNVVRDDYQDTTVSTLCRFAEACGFELVLRPKEGFAKAERTIVLEPKEGR